MCGILKNNYLNNKTNAQQQFGKMAGLVRNSTAVLRLNFCAKLNICASISATSPSCKPLQETIEKQSPKKNTTVNYENILSFKILPFISVIFIKY